jgi:hypothetical protein
VKLPDLYDAASRLDQKGDLDLEYNDAAHFHSVTDAGSNSYDYNQNGNQTHRLVHTIVNGQPVTQGFENGYDAENRLVCDRNEPLRTIHV